MKRVIEPLNPEVINKPSRQLGKDSSSLTAKAASASFEPKAKKPRVATSLPDIKQELVEEEDRNPIEASPLPLPVQLLSMQIKHETAGMEEERGSSSVDEVGSKRIESALNPDIEGRGSKRRNPRPYRKDFFSRGYHAASRSPRKRYKKRADLALSR